MLTKDNRYVILLRQAILIDFDETNYYRTLDIDTDITHIKKEDLSCFSIIGLGGEPSYYNICDSNTLTLSHNPFTCREREVLKAIVEGKNRNTIANTLNISLHTVRL